MKSGPSCLLDCTVEVRKYVLIAQPSRWRQKGERVVVQSAMLNISSAVLEVPVKRYHGDQHNAVCFLPRTDIERDPSNIYKKSRVTTKQFSINAHGVAIHDSSTSDDFVYHQGDKFWICVEADTSNYTDSVPVINLSSSSFQKGTIQIDQVCWFPRIQGPRGELWTLGGETRKLKHAAPQKFSSYSWVICQHLDTTKSVARNERIPTKDAPIPGWSLLSVTKSRELFNSRLQIMLQTPNESYAAPLSSHLPSPPPTPLVEHQKTNKELAFIAESPIILLPLGKSGLWERIHQYAEERTITTIRPYILRNSTLHPQEGRTVTTTAPYILRNITLPPQMVLSLLPPSISKAFQDIQKHLKTREDQRLINPNYANLGPLDINAALTMQDLSAADGGEPFVSPFSPSVRDDPAAAISHRYFKEGRLRQNPRLEGLCDRKDPDCRHTTKFTVPHFHSPAEKCQRFISKSAMQDCHETLPHEHCVSRLGPLPHTAGDCLLAAAQISNAGHVCCIWKEEDLEGICVVRDRTFHDPNPMRSARQKRAKIFNDIHGVRTKPQSEHRVESVYGGDVNSCLDTAGKDFLDNISVDSGRDSQANMDVGRSIAITNADRNPLNA